MSSCGEAISDGSQRACDIYAADDASYVSWFNAPARAMKSEMGVSRLS